MSRLILNFDVSAPRRDENVFALNARVGLCKSQQHTILGRNLTLRTAFARRASIIIREPRNIVHAAVLIVEADVRPLTQ